MWRGAYFPGLFCMQKKIVGALQDPSLHHYQTQYFVVNRNCCYRPGIHGARSLYEQKPKDGFVRRSFMVLPLNFSWVFIRKWWNLMAKLQASLKTAENSIFVGVPTQVLSCPATVTRLLISTQWIWLPPQAHPPIQWIATAVLQKIVPLSARKSCVEHKYQLLHRKPTNTNSAPQGWILCTLSVLH